MSNVNGYIISLQHDQTTMWQLELITFNQEDRRSKPLHLKDDAELITFKKSFHSNFIYQPPSNVSGGNKDAMSRSVITIIKHSSAAACNRICARR